MRFKRRGTKSKRQRAIRDEATEIRTTGNVNSLNMADAGICHVCGSLDGAGAMCPRCAIIRKDEAALTTALNSEKSVRYNEIDRTWEVFELAPNELFWTPIADVLQAGNAPFVSFELTWAMPTLKDLLSLNIS